MSAFARYSLLCVAMFFAHGVTVPFLPIFLSHQGFDAAAVGLLLAIGGPARVVSAPFLLWLIDLGVPARVLIGGTQLAAAALTIAALGVSAFWPMAALLAVLSFLHGPSMSITDAIVTRAARRDAALAYGRIRSFGSLSFIVASTAAGLLIARSSPAAAMWLMAAGMIAAAAAAQLAPDDTSKPLPATADAPPMFRSPAGALAAATLASAMIQTTHAGYYAFGSIHWEALGYSSGTIGVLWSVGVVAEVVLLYRLGGLPRTIDAALVMITIAALTSAARWTAMAFDPPLWLIFLLQISHAATFGLTLFGMMGLLSMIAPHGWGGRAQGVHAAALATFVSFGMYLGGYAYEAYGARAYLFFAACGVIALPFIAETWRRARGQPQSVASGG